MEVKLVFSMEFLGNVYRDGFNTYLVFYNFDGQVITVQIIDDEGNTEKVI